MHFTYLLLAAFSALVLGDGAPVTSPDHELTDEDHMPAFRISIVMTDGADEAKKTGGLSSCCTSVAEGSEVAEVMFDSGWVENHFFLYSDQGCENLLLKGMKGQYGDSVYGMQIGSWKVD